MDFLIAMDPAVKCLLLLLVVAILFVTEKIPLAVTSIASAVCCWLLGLVPLKEVFLGLADSTVVLFGGLVVVAAEEGVSNVLYKIEQAHGSWNLVHELMDIQG